MKILVTGASGQVGTEIEELLRGTRQNELLALGHSELDIGDRERVLQVTGEWEPEIIINAAAYTAVDACEDNVDRAFAANALGPRNLAEGARLVGSHLLHISTDYVFDGTSSLPYLEWDRPNPMSVYGRSKLAGEHEVQSLAAWGCRRAQFVDLRPVWPQHGENHFEDGAVAAHRCVLWTTSEAALLSPVIWRPWWSGWR